MAKWADYGISAVRFNATHTHIVAVRILPDLDTQFGAPADVERETVVQAIRGGTTFVTIFSRNGKWNKGQSVYIVRINGVDYLKTVDNGRAEDNLDDLPEF